MSGMEYPKRDKFFAVKVSRLLAKSCAAQYLGPEGCWLLCVIVGVEDAKKYSGPVTFYNEQLAPLCGFASLGRLIRSRKRCVETGWLHYHEGGKRKPAQYWVKIPKSAEHLPDSPVDESYSILEVETQQSQDVEESLSSTMEAKTEGKRNVSDMQTKGIRHANGSPPNLVPVPGPKPGPKKEDCSEVAITQPAEPPAYPDWPCIPGRKTIAKTYRLSEPTLASWRDTFPAVEVDLECRKAHAWIVANPSRRKTAGGMEAFLFRWLSRAQNGARINRLEFKTESRVATQADLEDYPNQ